MEYEYGKDHCIGCLYRYVFMYSSITVLVVCVSIYWFCSLDWHIRQSSMKLRRAWWLFPFSLFHSIYPLLTCYYCFICSFCARTGAVSDRSVIVTASIRQTPRHWLPRLVNARLTSKSTALLGRYRHTLAVSLIASEFGTWKILI